MQLLSYKNLSRNLASRVAEREWLSVMVSTGWEGSLLSYRIWGREDLESNIHQHNEYPVFRSYLAASIFEIPADPLRLELRYWEGSDMLLFIYIEPFPQLIQICEQSSSCAGLVIKLEWLILSGRGPVKGSGCQYSSNLYLKYFSMLKECNI